MTRSESEVNVEVEDQPDDKEHPEADKDTEADASEGLAKAGAAKEKDPFSPGQATRGRFSDLNSLTVSAVENAQYNNPKEKGEGPEEKYQPPEEKSWTESSMGEGVLPNNLDPVFLKDIQRRKELETENQEVAVSADQGKMSAEEEDQTFGEMPKEETMKFREVQKEK